MLLKKRLIRIVLLIFVLELVFVIHEYGHLREFQKYNVPIEEFSLGIGPLLWQHQASSFAFSVRLLPIMAYVEPTDAGNEFFREHVSTAGKIAIDFAGIRNNLVSAFIILFFIQFLGWRKGYLSFGEFAKTVLVTPFKMVLRFGAFLIGCFSWGKVNLADKFLLSTGEIYPWMMVRMFLSLSLALGLINLAPFPFVDGGHIAQEIFSQLGIQWHFPRFANIVIVSIFIFIANKQDPRFLEIDP